MFRLIFSVFFIVLFIVRLSSGNDRKANATNTAQFIAGVSLLSRTSSIIDKDQIPLRYKELQSITGLTASDVTVYLENIRTNPEETKQLYDIMRQIFLAQPDTIKK